MAALLTTRNKDCMASEGNAGAAFMSFLNASATPEARIHILTDSDADGLPAAAILQRALRQAGYAQTTAEVRLKFESAWSPAVIERLTHMNPQVLLITDLGSRRFHPPRRANLAARSPSPDRDPAESYVGLPIPRAE